ncbi:MAG: hypothetical protein K5641_07670 [Lachnospiraceae bacterium]|nr:hypothetical protein [Lachnospiraceae bacterium]
MQTMRLLSFVLPKERREQLNSISIQINEMENSIDEYIYYFSEKGWCAYDSLNITMVQKAVAEAKSNGVEAGEKIILSFYLNDVKQIIQWLKNKSKQFALRHKMLEEAFEEHFEGRYYASVPMFLIIIDGVVNDYTKSKGFFAEKTDVSAWDCLVGCDETLQRMKEVFSQKRTQTNADPIYVPYRNGILHGRDINYGNKYVSCKCVALMFAVADWIHMKESENYRKTKYEKEINPPPLKETLRRILENQKDKKMLNKWQRRDIIIGMDISSTPSADECAEYPYIIPLLEMLEAWRNMNYGNLSERLKNLYRYEQSERKRAGECRKMFAEKILQSYSLLEIEERGCSFTRLLVRITWNEDEIQNVGELEFGCAYQNEEGKPSFPWKNNGDWVLIPWNVSCLYCSGQG